MTMLYDPGENRHKHKLPWQGTYFRADFHGRPVGQCPPVFRQDPGLAQRLLESGIPYTNQRDRGTAPHQIFAVHEGVAYRALPTEPGRSWHGFPCRTQEIPRAIQRQLEAAAERLGCAEGLRRWLKENR